MIVLVFHLQNFYTQNLFYLHKLSIVNVFSWFIRRSKCLVCSFESFPCENTPQKHPNLLYVHSPFHLGMILRMSFDS